MSWVSCYILQLVSSPIRSRDLGILMFTNNCPCMNTYMFQYLNIILTYMFGFQYYFVAGPEYQSDDYHNTTVCMFT